MLECDNLIIHQGDFTLSATWHIPEGRKVAVLGPSGAGKSTLLNAISGFVPLHAGQIRIGGKDVTTAKPSNRDIAMLFQDGNLLPGLTLAQNAGLGLRPDLRLNAAQSDAVAHALDRVGLQGLHDRTPADISGGQQGRAALARVLLQGKALLLLDEPFSALGPALRRDMLDVVRDVVAETNATVLMITHHPADALRFSDDLIFVHDGRADPPIPTAGAFERPSPALQAYLG